MINNIVSLKNAYKWTIFHILLGFFSIISPWFLIIWIYSVVFFSFNKVLSSLMLSNSIDILIPLIVYICSFEILGRMTQAYPFLPWELSKYIFVFTSLMLIISGNIKRPYIWGIIIFFLLIPSIMIDKSDIVNTERLIFNLFGPISMSLLIIVLGEYRINEKYLSSLLKLIWFSTVTLLTYVILKTPDYSNLSFSLNADFATTGGFGSNQVSTIIGIGMFLSFYAWMNKLLFSGNHTIDGLFIGVFAYQGFLTFSRGGMLIGIGAIIIYYLILRKSKTLKRITKVRALRPFQLFLFAMIIIVVSYALIQNITEGNLTLRYLGETSTTLSGSKIKTINTVTTGRYEIFLSDLKLWTENFIFGTGAGASIFLRENNLFGVAAHTEISRLLAEHGLFGLFILFILLMQFIKTFRSSRFNINGTILFVLCLIAFGTSMHSAMRTFVTPLFFALSTVRIVDEN